MYQILVLALIFLLFISIVLWFELQQNKFELKRLRKSIFLADKTIKFVEKAKPKDYVPTKNTVPPEEVISNYVNQETYEVLRDAKWIAQQTKED